MGSFQNLKHKPAAGEKKAITQKLEWKATPKVGSLDYAHHRPGFYLWSLWTTLIIVWFDLTLTFLHFSKGGGAKKILEQKLEWKASSRIASLENIKHRPGGGTVRIFNERYSGRSMSEVRKPSSQPRQPSQLRCTSPTAAKPNGQANSINAKPQTAKPDLNLMNTAKAAATNSTPKSNSSSGHSSRISSGGQTNGGIQQKQQQPNNTRLINDLENLSINKPAQVNNTQKIDLLS